MRGTTRTVAVAALSAVALLAAGCGSGDSDDTATSAAGAKTGGEITVRGLQPGEPARPEQHHRDLWWQRHRRRSSPSSSTTTPRRPAPKNDIAESIETTDNQNFTVKLKQGYKFHDGTEVKAKNFVDAWNYAAYGPNAQCSGYFIEPIEGFADLQCAGTANPDDPCEGYTPKAKETDRPEGRRRLHLHHQDHREGLEPPRASRLLGLRAAARTSFFTDPKAFGDKPIGAGPFKLDSWTKEQSIVLSKFADYSGEFGGQARQGHLQDLPGLRRRLQRRPRQQPRRHRRDPGERPDRRQVQVGPARPQRAEGDRRHPRSSRSPSQGRPELTPTRRSRQAISMAIDRETIIKQIFNGTRVPATGWVSPVVDGYKADQCGEFCKFDPAKAKALLAEAGGFKGDKMTLSYNADAAHKEWTEATCNSIKQTLGVECQAVGVVDFATFRQQIGDRKMKGMFRTGWADGLPVDRELPDPDLRDRCGLERHATTPTRTSTSSSSRRLPRPTRRLPTPSTRRPRRCSRRTCPSIPMWYGKATMGWSEKVTGVKITRLRHDRPRRRSP